MKKNYFILFSGWVDVGNRRFVWDYLRGVIEEGFRTERVSSFFFRSGLVGWKRFYRLDRCEKKDFKVDYICDGIGVILVGYFWVIV